MCLGGPFSHVPLVAGDARAAAGQRPLRGPESEPPPTSSPAGGLPGTASPAEALAFQRPRRSGGTQGTRPLAVPRPAPPSCSSADRGLSAAHGPHSGPRPGPRPHPSPAPAPAPSPPPDRPVCTSADRFHRDPGVTGGPHLPRGVPCESARRAESATRKLSPASGPWWGGVTRGDGGGPKARGPPAGEQSQAGGCGPT